MFKKISLWLMVVVCSSTLSGCFLLVAGAVGGVGTAKWLSDKLVEEVSFPYDRSILGVKNALKELKLNITKETSTDEVTQIICTYTDGKTVWVDVHHVSAQTSRIEVRVGVWGGQVQASKVLDRILAHLSDMF